MKKRNRSFGQQPRPPGGSKKPRVRTGLILTIPVLGYGKIEFCRHAIDRMVQRGVTQEEVIEAINNPTSTGHPTQRGRERIRRVFAGSGKVVDVVYDEPGDRVRVITTFVR
jgi:uncharacterized protein YuzE